MAQWITRSTSNRKIAGSSPAGGAITTDFEATCNSGDDERHYDHGVHLRNDSHFYSRISLVVEHRTCNAEVVSSILTFGLLSSVGRAQDF